MPGTVTRTGTQTESGSLIAQARLISRLRATFTSATSEEGTYCVFP